MLSNGEQVNANASLSKKHKIHVYDRQRLVIYCDYRLLNNVTVNDAYPLPRTDACLGALSGAKWFSQMDLLSGYWQFEMAPENCKKTASATSLGMYNVPVDIHGNV